MNQNCTICLNNAVDAIIKQLQAKEGRKNHKTDANLNVLVTHAWDIYLPEDLTDKVEVNAIGTGYESDSSNYQMQYNVVHNVNAVQCSTSRLEEANEEERTDGVDK